MSFKAKVPLPAGVEVLRRYDRRAIDGNTSKLSLFTPSPTPNDPDNNYVNNPLPGAKNHVVLAMSVDCTLQLIKSADNIDPVAVVNRLKDAVIKVETNGGREERILHPLKDYMNFSQTRAAVAAIADGGTPVGAISESLITLQATGPRTIDNLFFFEPNESFTVEVLFNNGSFPAQSDWTYGRFGLEVELYLGQMNGQQLQTYDRRLQQAAG
ncbi:hypothetical protein CWD77_09355 [Rhodohalobacter barkolensis]|uniref:Uncharacterized protein n=1 Tax=Rhodohalobacter barkolensis TaxID=2053187 RepID=A0A2N0VHT0_9BACT|nr:hypothetical protein CWD77_09355 [Rhodohalobacter barkolensis]